MDDTIKIGFEPEINFSNLNVKINPVYGIILKNGSPKLINKIEAIRQWITKFCITVKDSGVYEGTGYGTRFKRIIRTQKESDTVLKKLRLKEILEKDFLYVPQSVKLAHSRYQNPVSF